MSGIVKGVKKVFKKVGKAVKKIAKSKVFKVALFAAAVYFGGAGLTSMMGNNGFFAGVANAGTSLASAGSSLMSGQFAAAGSHLSAGFAGSTYTAASVAAPTVSTVGTGLAESTVVTGAPASEGLTALTTEGMFKTGNIAVNSGVGSSVGATNAGSMAVNSGVGSSIGTTNAGSMAVNSGVGASIAPAEAGMTVGEGLMASAGVNAGTQAVGGYLNARAREEAEEEERQRRSQNIAGKTYGSDFSYDIQSAFTPQTTPMTVDQLRGLM